MNKCLIQEDLFITFFILFIYTAYLYRGFVRISIFVSFQSITNVTRNACLLACFYACNKPQYYNFV